MNRCEICGNRGYIYTYNSDKKLNEIQRCDECNIFESDFDARIEAENEQHEAKLNSI